MLSSPVSTYHAIVFHENQQSYLEWE